MLHEVDQNGQLVWQAETGLGTWFGNVEVVVNGPAGSTPNLHCGLFSTVLI